MTRRWITMLSIAAALGGCRDRRVEPRDAAPARSGPTFRADVAPYLAKNCAQARCHGDDQDESADLDLRPAVAYRQLVGAASPGRSGAVRVVAGHPEQSFLVDKLTGKLGRYEGKRMPLDPQTKDPLPETAEQRAFVEQVLVPWIAAGARDE